MSKANSVTRWIFLLLSALMPMARGVQAQPVKDYQIKAIFLFNFAQFVEWPEEAFVDAKSPIVIGVLGDDPFGRYLDEAVAGETVNGRPLLVQRYRRVEEIGTCHLLFISYSERTRLERILTSLRGRSILSVGDTDGFATRGGIIRFTAENKKTRLSINLAAAKAANLTISSKLLRAAEVIGTENSGQ